MEARVREILELAAREVASAAPEAILGGVILSGGVASVDGAAALAADVLGTPARVAEDFGLMGLTDRLSGPQAATAAGLLAWGAAGIESGDERDAAGLAGRVKAGVARLFRRS
jgi:cell division protein FtsA